MRVLSPLLRRLFPPTPLAPSRPAMDEQTPDRIDDPIAAALHAAVTEHERTAAAIRNDYDARLRSTIDELLERIGPHT